MQLPVMQHPLYDVQLLSIKQPVKIRPFVVKEQKLLMMAVEANDIKTTVNTIKQIIKNCVIGDIDVDALPLVDIETLFLNLRARSMGEITTVYFKCKNEIDPPVEIIAPTANTSNTTPVKKVKAKPAQATNEKVECGMVIDVPINLLQIPIINKDTQRKIVFTEDFGVMMKYPQFDTLDLLSTIKTDTDAEFFVVTKAIDYVYDKDGVYYSKDATEEEMLEFVMNLPQDKYELMRKFVEGSPRSKLEVKAVCPKCKYEHDLTFEGLSDFFL